MLPSIRLGTFLFFLSGVCGLTYQIIWVQLLSLQFGSSAWSITTVVSAFMAGLSIGSLWGGHLTKSYLQNPFRVYAVLELLIAVFGILSLPLFYHLDILLELFYGHFGGLVLIRFICSFVLFLIPTVLMGASLPVLIAGLGNPDWVARLYGVNTLGAAFGVVLSGFWLLPTWGLNISIAVIVGVGIFVSALAFSFDCPPLEQSKSEKAKSKKSSPFLLSILFISGFTGLSLEICWTRLLAPILGSSSYAFAIILAVILSGIGLGSLMASRSKKHYLTMAILFIFLVATVGCALFFFHLLPEMFVFLAQISQGNVSMLFIFQAGLVSLLLLLPAGAMGAILPVAILEYQKQVKHLGVAVGRIYAINTLGAILGSLITGFVIVPLWGASFCIVAIMFLCGVTACTILFVQKEILPGWRKCGSAILISVTIAMFFLPPMDFFTIHSEIFRQTKKKKNQADDRLIYYREGLNVTVTVYRNINNTSLKVNGKTDASTVKDLATQYLLGHLPLFFVTEKEPHVFVLGLGSGATAHAVATHNVASIDIAELEDAVVEASKYFTAINHHILLDSKVNLFIEDGRSFLRYRNRNYHAIISEPSNPWVSGTSSLFTREFYELVKKRLTPKGIFCQWIQGYEISEQTFRVMISTLADAFAHILIFQNEYDFICLASNKPITGNIQSFQKHWSLKAVAKNLKRIEIENSYELLWGFLASFPQDREKFAASIRNLDSNQWLQYRAPLEMYQGVKPIKIPPLKKEAYIQRVCKLFYPKQKNISINIAKAIIKREPQKWRFIQTLSGAKHFAMIAKNRDRQIQNKSKSLQRALKLMRQKKIKKSIDILKKVIKLSPTDASSYRLLAKAYLLQGKNKQALEQYVKATSLIEEDHTSWANMGLISYQLGKKEQGTECLEKALQINPKYTQGWGAWIGLLVKYKEQKKAKTIYHRALKILDGEDKKDLLEILHKRNISLFLK